VILQKRIELSPFSPTCHLSVVWVKKIIIKITKHAQAFKGRFDLEILFCQRYSLPDAFLPSCFRIHPILIKKKTWFLAQGIKLTRANSLKPGQSLVSQNGLKIASLLWIYQAVAGNLALGCVHQAADRIHRLMYGVHWWLVDDEGSERVVNSTSHFCDIK
jgi:hypothetical protein